MKLKLASKVVASSSSFRAPERVVIGGPDWQSVVASDIELLADVAMRSTPYRTLRADPFLGQDATFGSLVVLLGEAVSAPPELALELGLFVELAIAAAFADDARHLGPALSGLPGRTNWAPSRDPGRAQLVAWFVERLWGNEGTLQPELLGPHLHRFFSEPENAALSVAAWVGCKDSRVASESVVPAAAICARLVRDAALALVKHCPAASEARADVVATLASHVGRALAVGHLYELWRARALGCSSGRQAARDLAPMNQSCRAAVANAEASATTLLAVVSARPELRTAIAEFTRRHVARILSALKHDSAASADLRNGTAPVGGVRLDHIA